MLDLEGNFLWAISMGMVSYEPYSLALESGSQTACSMSSLTVPSPLNILIFLLSNNISGLPLWMFPFFAGPDLGIKYFVEVPIAQEIPCFSEFTLSLIRKSRIATLLSCSNPFTSMSDISLGLLPCLLHRIAPPVFKYIRCFGSSK